MMLREWQGLLPGRSSEDTRHVTSDFPRFRIVRGCTIFEEN